MVWIEERLRRGLMGCVDQHCEDRIDQIEKKSVALYSVWWFCSSLWLSLTSGKLLNVIFCALLRKESVWFVFLFLPLRSQIKGVLVWCDRVISKQMDTVFTRREKRRRDCSREHSLWVRLSGRKLCFRYTEQKALTPVMPPRLAADSELLPYATSFKWTLSWQSPMCPRFWKPQIERKKKPPIMSALLCA